MKSVVIFFNAITNFKSNLTALEHPDAQPILFINSDIFGQLTADQQHFFTKIHIIDPLTFGTTVPYIKQYLQEVKKEALFLVTNDEYCIPIVGQLIDYFGLPGYGEHIFLRFIDKIIMKEALNAHGIRTPYHLLFDKEKHRHARQSYIQEIEKKFSYPFVLKPVSLYGATSFKKIHNRTEWFTYAKQAVDSTVIFQIEEFIAGTLFHCDALVHHSKIIFNSISEYIWPVAFVQKGYPTGSIWLPSFAPHWNLLNEFHQRVITALQPPDGATHCELFLTEHNEVVFLEIAARPSGALVVPMIEKITGVNLELAHFNLRLQRALAIREKPLTLFSLFCYIPKKNGTVLSAELPVLNSAPEVRWHVKPGDLISAGSIKENDILLKAENIAATLILDNADFEELYADFLALKTAIFIKTEA